MQSEHQPLSWKQIQAIIAQGEAARLLPAGTKRSLMLKDGTIKTVAVAALDLYNPNEAIFVFREPIGTDHCMNPDWTNLNGWRDCEMRRYLNTEAVKLIPDDLLEVIRPKKTLQRSRNRLLESQDILFLPSEYEVFGQRIYAEDSGEDRAFPYFADRENRIVRDPAGHPTSWWLSSFTEGLTAFSAYFCYVHDGGYAYISAAPNLRGVAPGFVIR